MGTPRVLPISTQLVATKDESCRLVKKLCQIKHFFPILSPLFIFLFFFLLSLPTWRQKHWPVGVVSPSLEASNLARVSDNEIGSYPLLSMAFVASNLLTSLEGSSSTNHHQDRVWNTKSFLAIPSPNLHCYRFEFHLGSIYWTDMAGLFPQNVNIWWLCAVAY